MKILNTEFAKQFIELCDRGYRKGWHERNGGNLSYRIKEEEVKSIKEELNELNEWQNMKVELKDLANEYCMLTGSGKYMMNVSKYPEDSICIIEINNEGNKYKKVWGLKNGGKPTSEMPTHLMNLETIKIRSKGEYRVAYHCHATNLIALSYILPCDSNIFTKELWEMSTECPIVFPDGVGIVEWMIPGGEKIAIKTSEIMKTKDIAIWTHHGVFGVGPDFDTTFGLIDTVEKSAEILVKVKSAGGEKLQTITQQDFIDLAKDFGVELDKNALKLCKK